MKPSIGEPPLFGVDHDTITSSGTQLVEGVKGFAGFSAAKMLIVFEGTL